MDILQVVMDRARQHGLRMTRQRKAVLHALSELGGHACADRIHERATGHLPDMDRSTVYRTLERFRDLRILSQTDLGRGCAEYEVVMDQPHHHLVCRGCGHVIDLDHAYLATSAEAIRNDLGFDPIFDHFAIFGWCRACRSGADGQETRGRG